MAVPCQKYRPLVSLLIKFVPFMFCITEQASLRWHYMSADGHFSLGKSNTAQLNDYTLSKNTGP